MDKLPRESLAEIFVLCGTTTRFVLAHVSSTFRSFLKSHVIEDPHLLHFSPAAHGHTNVIEWLISIGCPACDSSGTSCIMAGAAYGARIDIIELELSNGSRMNELVCSHVAMDTDYLKLDITDDQRISTLMWLREHGCPWDVQTTKEAAAYGNIKLLTWAIINGCPTSGNGTSVCRAAALAGQISTLQWAIFDSLELIMCSLIGIRRELGEYTTEEFDSKLCATSTARIGLLGTELGRDVDLSGLRYDPAVMCLAVQFGHISVVEWIIEKKLDRLSPYLFQYAAMGGQLEMMKWLAVHVVIESNTITMVMDNVLAMKEWLTKGISSELGSIVSGCYYKAAENGHTNVLKWMSTAEFFNGVDRDVWKEVFRLASNSDKDNVLIWLAQNYHLKNRKLSAWVADKGHFDLLKTMIKKNHPHDGRVCAGAAKHGNLEVLAWLVERGCEVSGLVYSNAAEGGHLNVLRWLEFNNECSEGILTGAAMGGHLDVIKWALENGYEWCDGVHEYAELGDHQHIIEWCTENGY